jgi:20S proteasome subunit alpha 6
MFRNQYDTDVTTFSPAGRLHQVEYAMEAVKQGSCSIGIRSTHNIVVLTSLKRSSGDLASYQQKIYGLDSQLALAVSGLISDARVLAQYMRNECLSYRYTYSSAMPVEKLVWKVSDKAQVYTQKAEKRPYGVGCLIGGIDKSGAHLYQTDPSGVYFEFRAQAIGARAQSAKTYLEKIENDIDGFDREQLIHHALMALKGASPKKLTSRNVVVAVVELGKELTILEGDSVREYVARVTHEDDEDEDENKEDTAQVDAATGVGSADAEQEALSNDNEQPPIEAQMTD